MKKIIFSSLIFFTFALPASAEQILNYKTKIEILDDATINIEEKIDYDLGQQEKHGIYRSLPVKYSARGGNYSLRVYNLKVTDETGKAVDFSQKKSGNDLIIKIGDADKLVRGLKTYIITYRVDKAINYFNDHDELYWNVIGGDWNVPIINAEATVQAPANALSADLQYDCYFGLADSQEKCAFILTGNNLYFQSARVINPGENMTIVIGWPKGLMVEKTWQEKMIATVLDNPIIFIPPLIFLALLFLWFKKGRDAQGNGTIVTQFDTIDNLAPAEIGTIVDERFDAIDIAAEIIHLAVKGYIKINRLEEKNFWRKKVDYEFIKLKEADSLDNHFEKTFLNELFTGAKKSVKTSDIASKFYKIKQKVGSEVYISVSEKGYFNFNPEKIRLNYFIIGGIVIMISFLFMSASEIIFFSLLTSGLLIMFVGFIMPAKTRKGTLAKEHILGFKNYLSVAEKDRLEFHNAPEKNPALFEKFLPFAIALGVEKKWAQQFENIYTQQPAWYDGKFTTNFSALVLVNSLNEFKNAGIATAANNSSGFSGGGAGGGFGGGGGGSW